jgi:hypothetical protein
MPPPEAYHHPHAGGGWPYYPYPYGYYYPHYAAGAFPTPSHANAHGQLSEGTAGSAAANNKPTPETTGTLAASNKKPKVPPVSTLTPKNAFKKSDSADTTKSAAQPRKGKVRSAKRDNPTPSNAASLQEPSFVPFENVGADASRLAVEKLIDGSVDGEWSLMSSRMKSIMHNDGDMAATNTTLSRFPIDFENSNISGLSMLNEASKHAPELSEDEKGPKESSSGSAGASIMARVLENVSKSTIGKMSSSPTKSKRARSSSTEPTFTFRTPKKNAIGGYFSTTGTPFGFTSPAGVQSPNGILRAGAGLATNLSMPYSPTNSTVMGIFDDKANNDNGFLRELNLSQDHHTLSNPEEAVGAGETAPAAAASTTAAAAGGIGLSQSDSVIVGEEGFQTTNSLLIPPDAYEAVSALEALSNSPFRHAASSSQTTKSPSDKDTTTQKMSEDDSDDEEGKGRREKNAPRPSLFARVIGGITSSKKPSAASSSTSGGDNERSPKKKLKFY